MSTRGNEVTRNQGEFLEFPLEESVVKVISRIVGEGYPYSPPAGWSPEIRQVIQERWSTFSTRSRKVFALLAGVQERFVREIVDPCYREPQGMEPCPLTEILAKQLLKTNSVPRTVRLFRYLEERFARRSEAVALLSLPPIIQQLKGLDPEMDPFLKTLLFAGPVFLTFTKNQFNDGADPGALDKNGWKGGSWNTEDVEPQK